MTLGPMVGIVSMPGRRPIRASLPDCRPAPMVAVPRRHVGSLNAAPSFGTFRGTRRCTAWMEDVEKYQKPQKMSTFPGMLKCALFLTGLLEWSNTPRDDDLKPPVHRLMERRTRTLLPLPKRHLEHQTLSSSIAHGRLHIIQLDQKICYNRGSRNLPLIRVARWSLRTAPSRGAGRQLPS
ncbi:uncharacterized protein [Dermacentor albipictus]|uniref:uncharacterized protein isoform X1 n=1 Tax=Dermacentor albipictus TaxID=60249 RepID=UPI0038FC0A46